MKKKKNNSTYRRKTYKNRKRNTYKKRKNKTKRRRRNMKGGISLRERATTKVNNMRKRGNEFWEKHGDTIKKGTMDAAKGVAFGVAALAAHRLEKNYDKKKKTKKEHQYQKMKEEKEKKPVVTADSAAPVAPAQSQATAPVSEAQRAYSAHLMHMRDIYDR